MATIRPRSANQKQPFEIHRDGLTGEESVDGDNQGMDESRGEGEEDDGLDENYDSEESDTIVDPVVREDMNKFEDTFTGIKERFRLINRIGEGMLVPNII